MARVFCGIYHTKVGGHKDDPLLLENDSSIPEINPNCVAVKYPALERIPCAFIERWAIKEL